VTGVQTSALPISNGAKSRATVNEAGPAPISAIFLPLEGKGLWTSVYVRRFLLNKTSVMPCYCKIADYRRGVRVDFGMDIGIAPHRGSPDALRPICIYVATSQKTATSMD